MKRLAQLLCSLPQAESCIPLQKTLSPHLELAKTLFHLKEYQRAWHGLERHRLGAPETLTEQFLRLYAYYMVQYYVSFLYVKYV